GGSKPERLPALAIGSSGAGTRDAAAGLMEPYPGNVDYRVEGTLPSLADKAAAWSLGVGGDRARVAALARELGLDGQVEETADAWSVRSGDRQFGVQKAPGLPWYYNT